MTIHQPMGDTSHSSHHKNSENMAISSTHTFKTYEVKWTRAKGEMNKLSDKKFGRLFIPSWLPAADTRMIQKLHTRTLTMHTDDNVCRRTSSNIRYSLLTFTQATQRNVHIRHKGRIHKSRRIESCLQIQAGCRIAMSFVGSDMSVNMTRVVPYLEASNKLQHI